MNRIFPWLVLVGGVLALAASCATPGRSDPPAVAATVPYYGATYGAPGGLTPAQARRTVELLEQIAANTSGGRAPAAAKADPLPVAKARCAGCHTPGRADEKGGGFILLADDAGSALKPLSTRERKRVKEAVEAGTMPPAGDLPAAEKTALSFE